MNLGQQGLDGELHLKVPAVAVHLSGLRHALAQWAGRIGLSEEDTEALVLASYEAMANSVEHAYQGQVQDGLLEVRGQVTDAHVIVTVVDYGQWLPPQPSGGLRGRGLSLIKGLTGTATITPSAGGTTVSMSWPLVK